MKVIFEGQVWRKKDWVEGIGGDLEPHKFNGKEFIKYEEIYKMDVEEFLIKKDQKFYLSDLEITIRIIDAIPTIKKGKILDYHCQTDYNIRIEENTEENNKQIEKDMIFYENLYQTYLKNKKEWEKTKESWKRQDAIENKYKSNSWLYRIFGILS